MISTRRIVAAVALAAGASALAAPAANAATAPTVPTAPISPIDTIDGLARTGIPEERRDEVPTVASQVGQLSELASPDMGSLSPAQ
ncbi:hypothetical protein AB0H77_00230 [Streptomyces sp. NPDC050844]|uniref:hypothetical protein n=1 Tax=Streptomyces sp. NPDC050844 TaxID=3155790 RepID=UPI0034022D45